MAQKDRARYLEQMAVYKATGGAPAAGSASAAAARPAAAGKASAMSPEFVNDSDEDLTDA